MLLPVLAAVLLLQASPPVSDQQPDPASAQPKQMPPQLAEKYKQKREMMHQAALRLDDLASNIHSEQNARAFIDAVAEDLWGKHLFGWTTRGIRQRVAHAEFEAVSDAALAIPEQRIVNVWNEYIREIDAPEEELASLAEIHNMRDGMYVFGRRIWGMGIQSIWTVPSIQAVDSDGKLSQGCRAIEALKIIHALYFEPQSLQSARERVRQGYLPSDRVSLEQAKMPAKSGAVLVGRAYSNPVQEADRRYLRNHGDKDYDRMLMRLFNELFPKEQ